jgi:hypothetical protein
MSPSRLASLASGAVVFVFLRVAGLAGAPFDLPGRGIAEALLAETEARVQQSPPTSVANPVDIGDANKGLAYAQKVCSACHNVLRTEVLRRTRRLRPSRRSPTRQECPSPPSRFGRERHIRPCPT